MQLGSHWGCTTACSRRWTSRCRSCNVVCSKQDARGPGDTEETAIVRGGLQSPEAQGKGRKAAVQRWQAAEEGGKHQGRAKARVAAGGGGQTQGKGQGARSGIGGQEHGKGKGEGSSAAGRAHGKGNDTRGGGGGTCTARDTGRAAGGRGCTGGRGQGQEKGLGARRGGATRATADREHRAQGREGRGKAKDGENEAGGALQPEVQAVQCILPGIQHMPAHHATTMPAHLQH